MSGARESLAFLVIVNLVLTVAVVAAALTVFGPGRETSAAPDSSAALADRVASLERERDAFREELTATRLGVEDRLLTLERSRADALAAVAAGAGAAESPDGSAPEPAPAELTPEQRLMQGFGEMLRQQTRRQRDRFIDEVMNPTPESLARSERQMRRIAGEAARRIGLEERDREALEGIILDVDARRRERLQQIFASKADPRETSFAEVKTVLDDSFAEEDRLVGQTLPADKAQAYLETASPFRDFVYIAAQAAFPSSSEGR